MAREGDACRWQSPSSATRFRAPSGGLHVELIKPPKYMRLTCHPLLLPLALISLSFSLSSPPSQILAFLHLYSFSLSILLQLSLFLLLFPLHSNPVSCFQPPSFPLLPPIAFYQVCFFSTLTLLFYPLSTLSPYGFVFRFFPLVWMFFGSLEKYPKNQLPNWFPNSRIFLFSTC